MTERSKPNIDYEQFDEFLENVLRAVGERLNDHISVSQRLVDMKTLIVEPIQNPVEFEYGGRRASFQVLTDKKMVVVRSGDEDTRTFPYSAEAIEGVANAIVDFLTV